MIFENNTTDRRSRIVTPTPFSGLGKLPPQAIDLEEAVLGAIMIEKEAIMEIGEFLITQAFYVAKHQRIYESVRRLVQKGDAVDILTVTAELRAMGELEMIGGAYYITELTERVASAANIIFYARIIYQKYLQRELIRISTETIQSAYEDTTDVLQLMENNQLALINLNNFKNSQESQRIDVMIDNGLAELDKPIINGLTGVGTSFLCINEFTSGWQKGDLTILAARPAMGKTALMMQFARDASVIAGVPTAVFSLEMTKAQLTKRIIANEAQVFLEKINKKTLNKFDRESLEGKLYQLKNSPLFVDDTPALSTVDFRSKAIRLKKLHDIQIIFVDYLQLMRGLNSEGKKNNNREQEIGEITRCLKGVAKELDIPVIALSQLSRSVESRPGAAKRPMLQDLRESGNIEQDADNVIFLFRPEYYGITADENNISTESMAELIWAKHRMGENGKLYLKFRGALTRFENWVQPETGQNVYNQPSVDNHPPIPSGFVKLEPTLFNADSDEQDPPF